MLLFIMKEARNAVKNAMCVVVYCVMCVVCCILVFIINKTRNAVLSMRFDWWCRMCVVVDCVMCVVCYMLVFIMN